MTLLGLSIVAAGIAAIACSYAYVRRADAKQAAELHTALEWEAITGIQVVDYAEWRKEGIATEERITLGEFQRLCAGSATRHRDNLHPLSP